jgi:exonuclease VII small subunit
MMNAQNEPMTFEQAMARLEEIVRGCGKIEGDAQNRV